MAKKNHKQKKHRMKNVVAKDLFSPTYKPKTEAKLKGRGSYDRKRKEQDINKELQKCGSFYLCSHQKSVHLAVM